MWFIIIISEQNIIYNKNWIDETDGNDGHICRFKKIDKIQEILIAEWDNETNLVQNITEELILLLWLIIV